jgi:hypothetical protein
MFLSEAVESAKRPHMLHESKALNMGIAGLKPRHLAINVGGVVDHNPSPAGRFPFFV